MGCKINVGPVVARLAWIDVGDGFWLWVIDVAGFRCCGDGVDSTWLDSGSSGFYIFFGCDVGHGGGSVVVTGQWRCNARC